MTSINDFATTYMCQSLPFGGVKDSGFDRFAGIEGLRGLTVPKAVAEDRYVGYGLGFRFRAAGFRVWIRGRIEGLRGLTVPKAVAEDRYVVTHSQTSISDPVLRA